MVRMMKITKNRKGVSPVIATIIISGTLLIILVIASFVSANVLELQIANTEFEQAKTNMILLDQVIQDVAMRRGAGGYVQFNQRSGGINIIQNTETIKILGPPKQITFDAVSSVTQTTAASSTTLSHTIGTARGNRLLIVAVSVHIATGPPTTLTGVTYAGVSMTQVTTALYSAANPQVRTYTFRLVNPATGTNNIVVSYASPTLAVVGGTSYFGVNQDNPIQASNTATGSSTSPSVSVMVTGTGRVVFGHVGGHRTNTWTITGGSGQNNRWAQEGQLYKGRGSDKLDVAAGSVSMSWTTDRVASWVCSAVVINPAPADVIYESPSLVSVVYRGGSKVSGTDLNITGTNTLNVTLTDPLGYLRVETDNGLKIKLDYFRVRIVEIGSLIVNGTLTNFIEITFLRLTQGNMGGTDTINVKAQNTNINTATHTYASGNIAIQVELGTKTQSRTFSSEAQQTVVMFTEIVVQISTA